MTELQPQIYTSPATGREYIVVPHLFFSNGGYEKCAYDIYLETRKIAQCELTGEIPFTVSRFEQSP